MKYTENQIVEMLKQNDKRVVAIIYDQYAPALYGVVLRIVQSEATAEDVMQDAFVKIWKNGATYNSGKGTLFTWLLNITRNTAIDKTRSSGFRNRGKNQNIDHLVNNKATSYGNIEPDQIGLRELLNTLDNKYREIVDLIYFRGFSQKEASEHLNIPIGTVKTRLRFALRELRNVFDVKGVYILIFLNCISAIS